MAKSTLLTRDVVLGVIIVGSAVIVGRVVSLGWGELAGLGSALATLLLLTIIFGYKRRWPWTGLRSPEGQGADDQTDKTLKTLWDWLQLLVIPVVLTLGGIWFNAQQNRASSAAALEQSRDTALDTYLDRLSALLLDPRTPLRTTPDADVRTIARARTLAILRRLDGGRKGLVLLFLYDARLIDRANPVIRLDTADLSDVVFPAGTRGSNLPDIDEGGGVKVSFNGVNLSGANLHGANLTGAHLSRAVLIGADLSGATLHGADLRGVNLGVIPFAPPPDRPPSDPLTNNVANNATDLTNADLSGSFLNETYLVPATLTGKNLNLTGAHLTGAIMSRQQFVDLYPGRPCSHSTCRLPSSGK